MTLEKRAILAKVEQINSLLQEVRAYKEAHPEAVTGFYESSYGSLLNAYREGDISFNDCVDLLGKVEEKRKGTDEDQTEKARQD